MKGRERGIGGGGGGGELAHWKFGDVKMEPHCTTCGKGGEWRENVEELYDTGRAQASCLHCKGKGGNRLRHCKE